MSLVSGQGTTFALPNYHGRLFAITPEDTPFTTAIGGLTGGASTEATEFEWQGYDLRAAAQNVALEGAAAPTAQERARSNVTNVVQIHHEAVDISYTKWAAIQQYAGSNLGIPDNPAMNEAQWQIDQRLKEIKRDVEWSFLQGVYVKPTDNTTARKTRGILNGISTNVTAKTGTPTLAKSDVLSLLQSVYDSGGIQESDTATIVVNSAQKRWLTYLFITSVSYAVPQSRNVGGVSLQTIETDFGRLNVMLNRYMPTDTVMVCSLEECKPRMLLVPEKGFLFVEPLAKVGSSERFQLYGEIGLEYGNERKHGKITGLATTAPAG